MSINNKIIYSLLSLFLLVGCNEETTEDGEQIFCTAEFVYGLSINIFDQETGFPNACGVTVKIQDGDYIEEFTNEDNDQCLDDFTFVAAGERAGTYDITVVKEGYLDWIQYDTVVTSNICHVNPIAVQVYMDK